MKKYKVILLLFVSATIFTIPAKSQKGYHAIVKSLVELQNYVFEAQYVTPAGGRARQLPGVYSVTVSKDSIIANLPYLVKSDRGAIDASTATIKFATASFEYTTSPTRTTWNIVIKIKDSGDGKQLFLTVFDNGSASLQVTSNARDAIFYSGIVRAWY